MRGKKLDVKPGDKVYFRKRIGGLRLLTVKKVTPTGIIKVKEFEYMSFDPSGKSRHAKGFDVYFIKEMTPEVLFEIQNNEWKEKIRLLLGTKTDERFEVDELIRAFRILEKAKLS